MVILLLCILITIALLIIFYIWGKTLFVMMMKEMGISDCILFGFLIIHVVFQPYYMISLLSRSSFYYLAVMWIVLFTIFTSGMVYILYRNKALKIKVNGSTKYYIFLVINILVVVFLCVFIGLRPRRVSVDTFQYIDRMNEMVYRGTLWSDGDSLELHQGLNSFYSLFAVVSWVFHIKPIYLGHFTMRFLGVILCSLMAYRFGRIVLRTSKVEYYLAVSTIVPVVMLAWDTEFGVGDFFYSRLNESKAFCQILLFPMAVSIIFEMFKEKERELLWLEEFLIGLSAVPVAVSSLSIYPIIVFCGAVSLAVFDKCKRIQITVRNAFLCVIPNLLYLGLYILQGKSILRF